MNGVMMPSVSAGSSQREANVMWTPQVMVPSGAAAAGRATPESRSRVSSAGAIRRAVGRMGSSQTDLIGRRDSTSEPPEKGGRQEFLADSRRIKFAQGGPNARSHLPRGLTGAVPLFTRATTPGGGAALEGWTRRQILAQASPYHFLARGPHCSAALDGTDGGADADAPLASTGPVKQRRASTHRLALLIPARITNVTSPIRTHHT